MDPVQVRVLSGLIAGLRLVIASLRTARLPRHDGASARQTDAGDTDTPGDGISGISTHTNGGGVSGNTGDVVFGNERDRGDTTDGGDGAGEQGF